MSEIDVSTLPFCGEYAKSGRASCKKCKVTIEKGSLRLAIMVQSPMFDGKVPHWHHSKCFFSKARPNNVGEIAHFDDLRWEDQEKLRKLVKEALAGKIPGDKGKSQSKNGTIGNDFRVEYSKSGGAKCQVCEEKIKKGLVRVSKKEYQSQRALMYGPYDAWNHLACFAKQQEEYEFFDSGDTLSGFKTLSNEDQKEVQSLIQKIKGGPKRKIKDDPDGCPEPKKSKEEEKEDKQLKEEIKKQMKKLYYYRDNLSKLKKKELDYIMEFNAQELVSGLEPTLDRIADGMTFGALERCVECKDGQLVFKGSSGYVCTGDISEWTKCVNKTSEPGRVPFKIPGEFAEEYSWFKMYKGSVKKRVIPQAQPEAPTKQSIKKDVKKESVNVKPFENLKFLLEGSMDKKAVSKQISELGGKVSSRLSANTAAVISDSGSVGKMTSNIKKAKSLDIQVIPPEALDKALKMDPSALIKGHSICEWGSEPSSRIPYIHNSSKSGESKSASKSMKLTLKGGGCVDPDSGLENKCHVYKRGDSLYSAVLGAVSIQDGKNSYYKLQVLKHDKKDHRYYVFRSWGRVGTTIGGKKTEDFSSSGDAIREFERLYEEKTGNLWRNRGKFEKLPGKFCPLDIDFGPSNSEKEAKKLVLSESKSKLSLPIKELISLIFDVDTMKKTLVEFEIDLNKMPLGKLSRKQIEKAYSILNEAQGLLETKSESKVIDATNRFFTLIPHDFGMNSPPLLQHLELIKNKIEMLDNLLEIEVAYSLLEHDSGDGDLDPFDSYYKKLNTELEILDTESEEYKILEKYVKNTHAATHDLYTLEIESILKVNRKGESKKFKPFRKLPNRHLLWHGSRLTNYAGILSQGLKIAPPEAPVTGYMFGKGIYFADMISKSANYCHASKKKNTGILMLCDVALGNMYEKKSAEYVEKLPPGKHSTKGIGKTQPDPSDFTEIEGSRVPFGKGVKDDAEDSDLLYNEFIVYDVSQVQCKYLFRMKFNYKI